MGRPPIRSTLFLLLAALSLAACSHERQRTPTLPPAVELSTHRYQPFRPSIKQARSERETAPSPAHPAKPAAIGTEATCQPDVVLAIGRGARLLYSDRAEARRQFRSAGSSSPLADAYLGLMDFEDGRPPTTDEGKPLPLEAMLMDVRFAFEGLEQACLGLEKGQPGAELEPKDLDALLTCSLYDRHAATIVEAFGATHYSSRDNIMMLVNRRCIQELLAQRLPAARVRAVIEAEAEIRVAALAPGPPLCGGQYCGTMWYGMMIAATAPLVQALLAPETMRFETAPRTVALSASLRDALDRHAPALGEGICVMAAARGYQWSPPRCESVAQQAAGVAYDRWQATLKEWK